MNLYYKNENDKKKLIDSPTSYMLIVAIWF